MCLFNQICSSILSVFSIQKPGLKCDMCKSFNANNLKALAAHKRGCARKQTNSITVVAAATIVK